MVVDSIVVLLLDVEEDFEVEVLNEVEVEVEVGVEVGVADVMELDVVVLIGVDVLRIVVVVDATIDDELVTIAAQSPPVTLLSSKVIAAKA